MEQRELPEEKDIRGLSHDGQVYAGIFTNLSYDQAGVIQYTRPNLDQWKPYKVVCLPTSMRDDVIRAAHVQGGHMATESTVKRLQRSVFFPSMRAHVNDFIGACSYCHRKKRAEAPQKTYIHSSSFRLSISEDPCGLCGTVYTKFTVWSEIHLFMQGPDEQVV